MPSREATVSGESVVSSQRRMADEYSIQFEHFGWIVAHVSEATGVLSIASDWGNWSHRWDTRHLGCPTLTEFLIKRRDVHYLAGKLIGYGRDRQVSIGKTRQAFRKAVCFDRRARLLSRAKAAELWSEIGLWEDDDDLPGEFTWEDLVYEDTPEFLNLKEIVLPALLDAMTQLADDRFASMFAPMEETDAVDKIRDVYESGSPITGLHGRADIGVLLREIDRLQELLRQHGS